MDKKQVRQDFKEGRNLEQNIKTVTNWEFQDILVFLKATKTFDKNNKNHKQQQIVLWKSDLTITHFKSLLDSDLKEDLLHSFFSTPEHINKLFFKQLINDRTDLFIQVAKLSKSFINIRFLELYQEFIKNNRNIRLKNLYKEFDFLYKKNIEWNHIQFNVINKLREISIEDILIQTCSFLEIKKRADFSHTDNNTAFVQIRTTITDALSSLLSNINKSQTSEEYSTIKKFNNKLQKELPPVNPAKSALQKIYSPKEQISTQKDKVRIALKKLQEKKSFNYKLDTYAAGFADFRYICEEGAVLLQNSNFIKHKKNIKKYTYNDIFFLNKGVKEAQKDQQFYNINSALEYWKYLKLPEEHMGVSIEKVLLLLHTFSSWIIPEKRTIVYNEINNSYIYTPKVSAPTKFSTLFPSEYINAFEYTNLCKKICKYFNWEASEVEKIINYLSTDILNIPDGKEIDLSSNPFIKIGEQIFWMTNLLEDYRWVILLHKRLVTEGIEHNTQTAKQEKSLTQDFKKANINSAASHRYKFKTEGGTISGEIDTLAYKDKHLFIVEMKTTYVDEAPGIKALNHSKTIEGKAKYQLKTAVEYIKNNFDELKKIEELNIDCELSELTIVPLIVSNIFDYEGETTENGIIRISDFTLRIILNNDLADIMFIDSKVVTKHYTNFPIYEKMDLPVSFMHFNDIRNPELKINNYKFPTTREECNLWTSPNSCSPQDIINAIKENKVWGFIDEIWRFKKLETSIDR